MKTKRQTAALLLCGSIITAGILSIAGLLVGMAVL